jgi:O-antigen/teichoic acid export membrane protein
MYKNAILLLTASVVRYTGQLGIFVLFARLLGAEAAGNFAFALAVTAPVFILASLGMRDIYLTLRTEIALKVYERVRAATVLAAMVVCVGISVFFPGHVAILIAVVACSKALDAFNDLYGAALQKTSRIRLTVLTSAVVAVVQVGTLAIALALDVTMPVALGISTLSYLMAVVFVLRPLTLRGLPRQKEKVQGQSETVPDQSETVPDQSETVPDQSEKVPGQSETVPGQSEKVPGQSEEVRETHPRSWVEIARVGFPTGLSLGLITGLSTLPQYFLSWARGPAEVGRYAMLLYLVVAMEMALNALAQSWIPSGRQLEGQGMLSSRRILAVAFRWTMITVPLGFVAVAVATVAFPLILGPAYTMTATEILPLAVAMSLTPMVFAASTSLAIQNRYHWALIGSALTVLAGLGIGWALIKPFGIVGALWTFAACLALRSGAALTFTRHEPVLHPAEPAEPVEPAGVEAR